MVEFRFFSDRNFLGAVVVALIISFAMLGVFFFLALYMQDILGYSPLEAGIRFLPSTLMIVAVAPIAGRLADRFGPRWLIVAGLLMLAASLLQSSPASRSTPATSTCCRASCCSASASR